VTSGSGESLSPGPRARPGQAADDLDGGFDAGVEVGLLPLPVVEPDEVAQVLDDLLDPLQALARAGHDAVEVVEDVGQVDLRGQVADAGQELALVDLEGPLGLLVEAEDVVDVADVALEDGDVVADVGQRVVDLVGHAGDHLAERGELLGLDELALGELELVVGGLEVLVGHADRLGGALEVRGGLLQLAVADLELRLGQVSSRLRSATRSSSSSLARLRASSAFSIRSPTLPEILAQSAAPTRRATTVPTAVTSAETLPPAVVATQWVAHEVVATAPATNGRNWRISRARTDGPHRGRSKRLCGPAAAASPTPSTMKLKAVFGAIGIIGPP
jgi:hypothetical protein